MVWVRSDRLKRRRVTKSRSWCYSTKEETGVVFVQGWAAGAYEVRVNGNTIAQVTDKWMADMILEALKG